MEMKNLNRICPICGNKIGNVLGNVKMSLGADVKLPEEYDITTCTFCGFAFADTTSGQDDYNSYYKSDNCYAYTGELRERLVKNAIDSQVSFLQKYVDINESIIDIGCGSGDLLLALKNRGYHNLCGLDPSQLSIDRLEKQGINGLKKNIFEEWEGKYDVILVSAVLEHICDLNGFINICLSHLNINGKIYVEVPAVEGFERYYQSKPNYFNHEHINYFSKTSLLNLLGKHGCKALCMDKGEFVKCVKHESFSYAELELQNIFVYDNTIEYKLEKDLLSEQSILNYLQQNKNEEKNLMNLIEKSGGNCIVWGAGALSMQLMANEEFAHSVSFFVDNNQTKEGKDIKGKKIYLPDILYDERYADMSILICCMKYYDDIVKQIHEMKIKNDIIVYKDK